MNDTLYNKCKSKNLQFKHVAEVGVYLPETSNILNFIKDGIRSTIVEANPDYFLQIKEYFKNFSEVKLFPYAVWDKNGTVVLNKAASSSFIDDIKSSPAIANDKYVSDNNNKIKIEAKTFDKIDDGTIELISIDIEGGEWYVIKHLVSKPAVISIEMQWKNYKNPNYSEISEWMKLNSYKVWYFDRSDIVYCKENLFELTAFEKMKLKFKK